MTGVGMQCARISITYDRSTSSKCVSVRRIWTETHWDNSMRMLGQRSSASVQDTAQSLTTIRCVSFSTIFPGYFEGKKHGPFGLVKYAFWFTYCWSGGKGNTHKHMEGIRIQLLYVTAYCYWTHLTWISFQCANYCEANSNAIGLCSNSH